MEKELLINAASVLGTSLEIIEKEPAIILMSFESSEKTALIKNATNLLIDYSIEKQLKEGNKTFFHIKPPFDDVCPTCLGLYREFQFEVELIPVTCKKCDGSGYKKVPCKACDNGNVERKDGRCPVCKDTKKYEIRPLHKDIDCTDCDESGKDKEGNTCKLCNGTKRYRSTVRKGKACPTCKSNKNSEIGLGHVNVEVPTGKIIKSWDCRTCDATGRKNKNHKKSSVKSIKLEGKEKPEPKSLTSPLLSNEMVKKLKVHEKE